MTDTVGWRGTPYNCLYIHREGTIFRLHVYERAEISSVEVYESRGKSVVLVTKWAQKGKQIYFMVVKKLRKLSGFVIYLDIF